MRTAVRLLPALALAAALGCTGEPEKIPTYPVSGQVKYAGKPAAGVKVFLYPTSAPVVPEIPTNPNGVTGPDGRFTLNTYGNGDGAPEGGYQVILLWPPAPEEEDDEEEPDADRLLGWYDAKHSSLSVRIKPGDNSLPVFDLPARSRPAGETPGVPGRN